MAGPTEKQKRNLDIKTERIARHKRAISSRKPMSMGLSKREFHHILDKASQPIEKPESDQAQS